MSTSEPINLDQKRKTGSQQAELEQATKQLMSALVRTFKAQQAIEPKKDGTGPKQHLAPFDHDSPT